MIKLFCSFSSHSGGIYSRAANSHNTTNAGSTALRNKKHWFCEIKPSLQRWKLCRGDSHDTRVIFFSRQRSTREDQIWKNASEYPSSSSKKSVWDCRPVSAVKWLNVTLEGTLLRWSRVALNPWPRLNSADSLAKWGWIVLSDFHTKNQAHGEYRPSRVCNS